MTVSTHPRKIYVELTTRCNLQCAMCVKHAPGSFIAEKDMELSVFKRLAPALSRADSLILNGIGEPLLHHDLARMIRLARKGMATGATIGFQSNGILLDAALARELTDAGLDTICFSLDSLERGGSCDFVPQSGGHSFTGVKRALKNLDRAKGRCRRPLSIGLETILTRENIEDLPELVKWAGGYGVNYIITTHLIPYDKATEESTLFNPNSRTGVDLYRKYSVLSRARGIDFTKAVAHYRKYVGTRSDSQSLQLIRDMTTEARRRDIRLNLDSLSECHAGQEKDIAAIMAAAKTVAATQGIDIVVPPFQSLDDRSCPFLTSGATFIAPSGDVMPCHFLWHTYSCRVLNEDIHVQKRVYGNILKQPLESVWQEPDYVAFRKEAGQYQYSSCWNCSQGPCGTLVNDDHNYANDCYGSNVPCGHCHWSLGGVHCL
ncbi:radical SAM/SPASM family putative metalloenzyme maturase [Desulforhopalus singaporensis]|uniref:Putative metalloenzyme radical SAM/SPASM domain maturase n=1 Tax=Desulforhopalus singaporensis TaxID=91360 RepID=A0A1H0U2F4_9BACT|nr:radical SAM/SPASM family putative metalloenzyme maturase [Desulforhopalus singaporensis]SDP60230.1 putative metalloenzyme radical SAM/SPASM domain maturase [Desulforhopalus singaporensis]